MDTCFIISSQLSLVLDISPSFFPLDPNTANPDDPTYLVSEIIIFKIVNIL